LIGRKRFLTVDTLGLVLRVLITAASVGERQGGKEVLLKVKQMGHTVSRLHTIWVDAGFNGNPFMQWVMDFCRWIVQVVLRPCIVQEVCLAAQTRLLSSEPMELLSWCRRLNKDYELLPETAETFVYLAMIRVMVRRLA
jgi:transposase